MADGMGGCWRELNLLRVPGESFSFAETRNLAEETTATDH